MYAEDTLLSLHAKRSLSLSSTCTLSRRDGQGDPSLKTRHWRVNTTPHFSPQGSAVPLSCHHVWIVELQPRCGPPLLPDDTRHTLVLLEGMTRSLTLLSLRRTFLALRPRLRAALCLPHTCGGRGGSCGLVKAGLSCYVSVTISIQVGELGSWWGVGIG
jgi:hypothetical protein